MELNDDAVTGVCGPLHHSEVRAHDADFELTEPAVLDMTERKVARRGHPPLREGQRMERVNVYLYEEQADYLRDLNASSASEAARRCIEWYRNTHNAEFAARCQRERRDPAEVLAEMMEGYITMPTPAEVREAIERGPEDDSASPAS